MWTNLKEGLAVSLIRAAARIHPARDKAVLFRKDKTGWMLIAGTNTEDVLRLLTMELPE